MPSDLDYIGTDPFDPENEVRLDNNSATFFLKRKKKRKEYQTQYDASWEEVVSFDVCEVHYCKDELSWPLDEDPPDELKPIDTAGILFLYTLPHGRAFFPIWSIIP
ncbi:hypothetical protein EU546_03640, partial [Candidatus Thorarchaeota archaeon]